MLDFICMDTAELFGTGRERKIQSENICLQRDSNPRHATPRQVNQRFRPLGLRPLIHLSWSVVAWVRIPLETNIFILKVSFHPRSEQLNGAHANKIKHDHSLAVIVVLDLRYDKSYQAFDIYSRSIALTFSFTTNVTISTSISQTFLSLVAIFASLWCVYLTAHAACRGLLLLWLINSEYGATFI